MSRCLGGTRFTTVPPIAISPSPISSSPAIIRSSVDLPLHAEKCRVRRQDHLRVAEQRTLGGNRLDRQHVKSGAGKYSTIECCKQIVSVDDRAARGVYDIGTGLHSRENGRVDHASRL